MDMETAPQLQHASWSFLMQAGDSLRYEITFGLVMLASYFICRLAKGLCQKRSLGKKGKEFSNVAMSRVTEKPLPQNGHHRPSLKGSFIKGEPSPNSLGNQEQVLNIDEINPNLLRNAAWLVPQVTSLCRAQVHDAIAIYRAAIQNGLKLDKVPPSDCRNLFASLVTSAIRVSQMDEAMQLLQDLRERGPGVSESLFASVTKLCTSKHLFKECLAVYDFMVKDPDFVVSEKSIWSCLLFSAIEVRAFQRCGHFFDRLKACGAPSHKDYGNMVRLASLHGDWQLSLNLVREMHASGAEIDSVIYNTTLATCVGADQVDQARELLREMESTAGVADVITYNTLMKGYAKAGRMDHAFELFEELKLRNIAASQVTYGIILDGYINDNQLGRAAEVFTEMTNAGCSMNTVLYTTLIKGFARAGEVEQAMKVYGQMRNERGVPPDLITFSILIKANCDADRLEEALTLLEAMLSQNLRPDEVVFNNLLGGCWRQANAELGKRLYADMIASGIRPSNATFSILIRLFHQSKQLEDAVEMLRIEPSKHKVDPEPRLFLQLLQSCIRERQGRRAVEVYEMLISRSTPTVAAHNSMFTTCVKLNMYDTAAEILAIAAEKGGRVDAKDANSLLDGAMRKRRNQVAHDIATSIKKLGLAVDPKLMNPTTSSATNAKGPNSPQSSRPQRS